MRISDWSSDVCSSDLISRKNGFELGAGWNRFSQNTAAEYISVSLSAPEFGTIYGNVAPAPGDDPLKKVIIWNPPSCSPPRAGLAPQRGRLFPGHHREGGNHEPLSPYPSNH